MRTIAVVTVGRSDYGIYLPVLRRIAADKSLKLRLIVAGMHLSPEFGETVKVIEADGFEVADRVDMLLASDSPEAVAKSMGLGHDRLRAGLLAEETGPAPGAGRPL